MSNLWRSLLVASYAVGACGREEAPATVLTATVSPLLAPDSTTHAIEHACKQQASHSSPHESESLDTHAGALAIGVELVASLDVDGT